MPNALRDRIVTATEVVEALGLPEPRLDDTNYPINLNPAPDDEVLETTLRISDPTSLVLGPYIPLEALRQLGSYYLIEQLGSGGMGIVFAARDRATGEEFALKILRPSLVMEPEAKQRFSREARSMAAIGHQRIVPVIRIGEDQGIPYIVMPLLLGETLEDRLHQPVPLTIDEIIRIGAEIAEGLEAAHQHGLIHRDVKPANVWLEAPHESVCLLDFGLARELSRETLLTDNGIVMGTPAYMSPEQARCDRLDPRCDLFSLGCILYQMTTGIRPFDGPTPLNILHQLEVYHPPRAIARNPAVPALLSNLIMELLAKNVKDRPPSARDVMERLRRIPILQRSRSTYPSIDYSLPIESEPSSALPKQPIAASWSFWMLLFLAALAVVCSFAIR